MVHYHSQDTTAERLFKCLLQKYESLTEQESLNRTNNIRTAALLKFFLFLEKKKKSSKWMNSDRDFWFCNCRVFRKKLFHVQGQSYKLLYVFILQQQDSIQIAICCEKKTTGSERKEHKVKLGGGKSGWKK